MIVRREGIKRKESTKIPGALQNRPKPKKESIIFGYSGFLYKALRRYKEIK